MQPVHLPLAPDGSVLALNPAQRALIAGVRGYRLLLSPWPGASCRFWPTCSAFAIDALAQHGAWRGSLLAAGRIARCQPWCSGGHDPVPPPGTGLFTALLRRQGGTSASSPPGEGEQAPTSIEPLSPPVTPDPVSRKLSA